MQPRTNPNVRVEIAMLRNLCARVNSPLSLGVDLLLRAGDYSSVLDIKIDPNRYQDASSFRDDYLIVSYLSKWKGWDIKGLNPRQKALSGWRAAEDKCHAMNRSFETGAVWVNNPALGSIFHAAQRKIAQILGKFDYRKVLDLCRWGPGATYDLRRGCGLDKKISNQLSTTLRALPHLRLCVETDPNWIEAITGHYPCGAVSLLPCCYNVVRGGRLLVVPKNAKTDRVIIAEPTGNSFLQQGVGRYIRKRLALFGIDLNDQTINQRLASEAFRRHLATIDLSSASDTISLELVWNLLPFEWFTFLMDLRSPSTLIDGDFIALHKFSSMGNAFTFELETLIFYALAEAARKEAGSDFHSAVYGDDIIVESKAAEHVITALTGSGFTVNSDKSFTHGSFYESCGKHYFAGEDVTPIYQKEVVRAPEEIIRAFNRLYRYNPVLTSRTRRMVSKLWNHRNVPRIPVDSTDDGGFLSDRSLLGEYDRNHGFRCVVYIHREGSRFGNSASLLANKLRCPYYTSADPKGQPKVGDSQGRYVFSVSWRH